MNRVTQQNADKARLAIISFLFSLTAPRVMALCDIAYKMLMEQIDEDEARKRPVRR
jgi:hypothetical protein